MKKSELKEMIKSSMLSEASEFDINKPSRIESFLRELDNLVEEYHAELYLNDDLFAAIDDVKSAANLEMTPVDEIPGFEGTLDALDGLGLEEAKKEEEVEEEEVEDVDVDEEGDINLEDEEVDMEVPTDGGDKDEIQSNLQDALEAAKKMGDQKLVDQIGNTITFFTRTHIVGQDVEEVEEVELNEENISLSDLEERGYEAGGKAAYTYGTSVIRLQNRPDKLAYNKGFMQGVKDELGSSLEGMNGETEELNEGYTRMQKLAGIIKG